MTAFDPGRDQSLLRRLTDAAGRLGYEIVDIVRFST